VWQLVFGNVYFLKTSPRPVISFPNNLTGRYLAIECETLGAPQTWYRAGYLQPMFSIGQGIASLGSRGCRLGLTIIRLSEIEFTSQSFRFNPVPWLLNLTIQVYSTDELEELDPLVRIERTVNDISTYGLG
jgi:hypothetical protein